MPPRRLALFLALIARFASFQPQRGISALQVVAFPPLLLYGLPTTGRKNAPNRRDVPELPLGIPVASLVGLTGFRFDCILAAASKKGRSGFQVLDFDARRMRSGL